MTVFEFDRMDVWAGELRSLLSDELPDHIEATLRSAEFEYYEDACDLLLEQVNRERILSIVSDWLKSKPMIGYHGSRLTPSEIEGVRASGLRRLVAANRGERLAQILSSHPRWPEVEVKLIDALVEFGPGMRAGRREGQVHLTLSRAALTRSFNHYLVMGSEFDGRLAHHLLGDDGHDLLRHHGQAVLFRVHVPAGLALSACNPYGAPGGDPPSPVLHVLRAWSYGIAHPDFDASSIKPDIGMVFRENIPKEWIEAAIPITDDLLSHYRS